jgi:histidine triad (HIT) family protein
VHVLLIPKIWIENMQAVGADHQAILGYLLAKVPHIAGLLGVAESGYRLIINTGAAAGNEVPHLHIHLLGGAKLGGMNTAH